MMYFLLFILMYFSPCRGAASDSSFTNSAILDANGNYELFWKFDNNVITFEVQVKTSGWIGFGISPNGGMAGSDMVIGWIDSTGSSHFAVYVLELCFIPRKFKPCIQGTILLIKIHILFYRLLVSGLRLILGLHIIKTFLRF